MDDVAGEVFSIVGGPKNSASLLEVFALLQDRLGFEMRSRRLPWSANDRRFFVADIRKETRLLGWVPKITREARIDDTLT